MYQLDTEAALKNVRLALGFVAFLAAACQGPTVPSIPLETLLSAPEQVAVGGRTLTLETFVWRDFMPGGPPDGSELMAVALITAQDQRPYPIGLNADKIWVIYGDEVWEADFTEESGPPDQVRLYQLQKNAYGGPKWEIGIEVEVVVRLVPAVGARQLLRASAQKIGMTV
jgi:hypothetical protein